MPPPKRINHFKDEWIIKYKWLEKHKSPIYAYCKVCSSDIHLGSIRLGAIESHKKGKKHISRETLTNNMSVKVWCKVTDSVKKDINSLERISASVTSDVSTSSNTTVDALQAPSTPDSNVIDNYMISDEALKAEIYWALHNTVTHHSHSSSQAVTELFRHMFPDSKIAKSFKCGKTKLSYLITFGLAPYFTNELIDILKEVQHFVLLFDESFNRVTKNEQMDVHVRFWDSIQQKTVTRYLRSEFLGHCTAQDLMIKIKESTNQIDTSKMIQISMDGPNVNKKFYRDYCLDRSTSLPDAPNLIDIGSCGLHVIHGAFKTGANATGWKLDNLLRSLYYLFNESPARRADYTAITDSEIFPLQFCSTRWIEDVNVAQRAVEIWGNICKYIGPLSNAPKSKRPKSASFATVVKAVNDPLTLAKLNVFISTAKRFMPFLEGFQTDKPLVPFLSQEMYGVLSDILKKIIQRSIFDKCTQSSICNLDLKDAEIMKKSKYIDIGFVAKESLKQSKVSEVTMVEFYHQCKEFFKETAAKIMEKSPLKYAFVRDLDFLNPNSIVNKSPNDQIKKIERVLSKMCKDKLINITVCDDIIKQYSAFVSQMKIEHKEDFEKYNCHTSLRIDSFLGIYMSNQVEYADLWNIVKMLLILSHGQASVERGFSINKDLLKCNMSQKTLIAERIVTDSVKIKLGEEDKHKVYNINISNKLLMNCRAARMRYQQHLDEVQRMKLTNETMKRKNYILEQISSTKSKKQKLENISERLFREADELAIKAESEKDISLIKVSNSKREKGKKMQSEATVEAENLLNLNLKLKKVE